MAFIPLDPDDHPSGEGNGDVTVLPARRRGTASSMLMAAMLGLADALGWEKPKDETVEVADAPTGDDSLRLDYKHLDPLDP